MDTRALDKLAAPEMLEALKTMTASSITAVVLAAKLLDSRRNEPAVAEWFAERSTRAALLAWEKVDEKEREALQTGPTALCNDHVPAEDAPWQCGKCGKPLGPIPARDQVTADVLVQFAIAEGFSLVAVVGLRVERRPSALGGDYSAGLIAVDGSTGAAPGAPPVMHELATQMRKMADQIDAAATKAGQGIVSRVVVPTKPTGEN